MIRLCVIIGIVLVIVFLFARIKRKPQRGEQALKSLRPFFAAMMRILPTLIMILLRRR
jgi:uncharacterized membrane protein YdjX (TVP38/TMEM64 family)